MTRAEQRAEALRKELLERIEKEASLKSRLVQIEEEIRPESIERAMNPIGSTRTVELRDVRRRVLENERSGPIVLSAKSLKVVLADGTIVEARPTHNANIFNGVIGGYGGLGVIVEATLELTDNVKVKRHAQMIPRLKTSVTSSITSVAGQKPCFTTAIFTHLTTLWSMRLPTRSQVTL